MLSAIKSPVLGEVCIGKWIVDDHEVELLQKGDSFRTVLANVQTGKHWFHDYPNDCATPTNVFRDYLLSCQVMTKDNEQPRFLPKHTWTCDNKTIDLIRSNNKLLVCELSDKTVGTKTRFVALECLFPSYRCHQGTLDRIEEIKTKSLDEQIAFFKAFRVTCIIDADFTFDSEGFCDRERRLNHPIKSRTRMDMVKTKMDVFKINSPYREIIVGSYTTLVTVATIATNPWLLVPLCGLISAMAGATIADKNEFSTAIKNNRRLNNDFCQKVNDERINALASCKAPFLLEIEPHSAPSQLDNNVRVSQFMWAVTVICYLGSYGTHARIVVEGLNNGDFSDLSTVKNGNYFLYHAEFNGNDDIDIEILTKKIKYEERTETWKVPTAQVISMLKNIKEQKKKVENGIKLDFCKYFPDDEHPNCCWWCICHLEEAKIVDLKNRPFSLNWFLRGYVKNYTKYVAPSEIGSFASPFDDRLYDSIDCSEVTIKNKESL